MDVKEIQEVKTKEDIIAILDKNEIAYSMTKCNGREKICISFDGESNCYSNSAITIQTCNKDICRVYPNEILYIAIEDRKTVLYLTDRKIETNYHIDYWKRVLNEKCFVQQHYSYIDNPRYVEEVIKDFVTLRCGEKKYKVYASMRKIGAFKKFFKFQKIHINLWLFKETRKIKMNTPLFVKCSFSIKAI